MPDRPAFIDPITGPTEQPQADTSAAPAQGGFVDPVRGANDDLQEIPLPFDPSRREFTGREDTLGEAFAPSNIGQNLRTNLARTLTLDPERRALAFQEIYPDAEINRDTEGNLLVKIPGRTPEFVNRPGADVQDVIGVGGQAGLFYATGGLAGRAPSLLGRAASQVGLAGGTDVAMQAGLSALGGGDIDPLQTGIVAGTGGASELAAPFIAPIARRLTPQPGLAAASGELGREGIEAAADIGSRAVAEGGEVALRQAPEGVVPAVVAAEREFAPDTLTRGMRSGDEAQIAFENRLAASDLPGSRQIQARQAGIDEALTGAQQRFQAGAGPRPPADSTDTLAQVAEDVAGAARVARENVSDLYERARQGVVSLDSADRLQELSQRVTQRIQDLRRAGDEIAEGVTPQAFRLQQRTSRFNRILQTAENVKAPTLQRVDALRKNINNRLRDAAPGSSDQFIVQQIKNTFDEWFDETIEAGLFSGDTEAITALREARQARAAVGQMFENPRFPGGRGVDRQVASAMGVLASPTGGRAATAGEALNALFGAGKLGGKQSSVKVLRHLRNVFGEGSETWGSIRQAAIARLWRRSLRDDGGIIRGNLQTDLREAMTGSGKELMQEIFSPDEIRQLQRFRRYVNATIPPGRTTNPSGTAQAIMRRFQELAPTIAAISGTSVAVGEGSADQLGMAGLVAAALARGVPWARAQRSLAVNAGVPGPRNVTPRPVTAIAPAVVRQPEQE